MNSIEQLDPLSDEWTTFMTMPEKLITPSKSLPVNVIHAEPLDTERQNAENEMNHEETDLASPSVKKDEDGTLFEMDLDSVENRTTSPEETDPTKDSSSSSGYKILKESSSYTQKSQAECKLYTDNDQISAQISEPISKHVLRLV